jgi:hypothetical protein
MINVSPNAQADDGADQVAKVSKRRDISWETVGQPFSGHFTP